MRKVYLKVVQTVIVNTDCEDINEVMDNLDFTVYSDADDTDVLDHEVKSWEVLDSD